MARWGHPCAIFLNDGEGRFPESLEPFGFTASSTDIETGDFDGDGDSDVAISSVNSTMKVLINDGNLGFTQLQSFSSSDSICLELADLDQDGDLDIVEGGRNTGTRVYQNDGTGL